MTLITALISGKTLLLTIISGPHFNSVTSLLFKSSSVALLHSKLRWGGAASQNWQQSSGNKFLNILAGLGLWVVSVFCVFTMEPQLIAPLHSVPYYCDDKYQTTLLVDALQGSPVTCHV